MHAAKLATSAWLQRIHDLLSGSWRSALSWSVVTRGSFKHRCAITPIYQVIVGIAERAEARAEAEVEESRRHRAAGPTPVAERVGEVAHRTFIRDLPACEREKLMEGAFNILGKARRGA